MQYSASKQVAMGSEKVVSKDMCIVKNGISIFAAGQVREQEVSNDCGIRYWRL